MTWQGNAALEPMLVELGALQRSDHNPRLHGPRSIEVIGNSYRRFGQQKPIVALEDGRIISGNGQHAAAESIGWTHIAAVRFPDEDQARAFAITDNRSAELSAWDFEILGEDFAIMVGEGENLEALGWAPHEQTPEWMRDVGGGRDGGIGDIKFGRSVSLTVAQREIFERAAALIREGDTEMSDGRVVELLSAEYLSGQ